MLQQGAGAFLSGSVLITAGHVVRHCAALWIIDDAGNQFVSPASPAIGDHDIVLVVVRRGLGSSISPTGDHDPPEPDAAASEAIAECVSLTPLERSDRVVVHLDGTLVGTEIVAIRDSRLYGDRCVDLNLLARPGLSGSPIMNSSGKLVGILVAGSPGATVAAQFPPSFVPRPEVGWRPLSELASEVKTSEEQVVGPWNDPETQSAAGAAPNDGLPLDPDAQMFLWQHLLESGQTQEAEQLTRTMARAAGDTITRARVARELMGLSKRTNNADLWSDGLDHLAGIEPWSAFVWDTTKMYPELADDPRLTTWYLTPTQKDWYAAEAAARAGDRQTVRDLVLGMEPFWWQLPPPDIDLAGLLGICDLDAADELETKLRRHPMHATNRAAGEAVKVWQCGAAFARKDLADAERLVSGWTSDDARTESRRRAALARCLWALGRSDEVRSIVEAQFRDGWWNSALARTFAWLAVRAFEPQELAALCLNPDNQWNEQQLFSLGVLAMGNMHPEHREMWLSETDALISARPEGSRHQSMRALHERWSRARSALDSGVDPDEVLARD